MALLRAPNQFSPVSAGGPTTPSCCGCCCCCCCAGTVVAASVALPLLLAQITRPAAPPHQIPPGQPGQPGQPGAYGPPASEYSVHPGQGSADWYGPPPAQPPIPPIPAPAPPTGPAPGRTGGIVLAALALPVGLLIAFSGVLAGDLFIVTAIIGLVLMLALAGFGYHRAGLATPTALGVPLLVLGLATAVFAGEVMLWLLVFDETFAPLGIAAIIAIPALTIAGILAAGAARRRRRTHTT